jgi:outer membrane protein
MGSKQKRWRAEKKKTKKTSAAFWKVSLWSSSFLLSISFALVPSFAQSAESLPLTWESCVRLAAQHNPDLLSAIQAMEARQARYRGSYNGILPQLSLTNSYLETHPAGGTSKLWQAQGTASLDVIDVGQWANIRSAAAILRQSQANQWVASSNVLLSLYKAFAALLYSQEETGVATSIRDLWNTNAQMIDLRYDSGRESKGNNMRTAAEDLQAQMALKQAYRDIQVAKRQLAQALGQEDFSVLIVTGTFTMGQAPPTPPNFDS